MKTRFLRWFLSLVTAICLTYVSIPALAVEKQDIEKKVAAVNGVLIIQGDFDREMIRVRRQLSSTGRAFDESQLPEIKKMVLETLINRELLYQEGQNKGIKVEDKAVNEQLNNVKKSFSNDGEFKDALLKMKISETSLKFQILKEIAIQQFIDQKFIQKTKIPENDLKAFYDSHPESFKEPEQVRARHILINVDSGADESTKAEARNKIKEIQERLQKGEDFAALAKEFSEGPSGKNGGDLGFFKRGQMVKPFEEAAFALLPGKVSDLVETRFGYHLIKVIDKKPESTVDYEKVRDRLQQYLQQQKVREKVDTHVEELKVKAKVERFL